MIGFLENCYFAEVVQFSLGKKFYQNMSTQTLRFFVIYTLIYLSVKIVTRVLKRPSPNSRACALETTASFLALPVSMHPRAYERSRAVVRPWERGCWPTDPFKYS
jgi:hypothetical protein